MMDNVKWVVACVACKQTPHRVDINKTMFIVMASSQDEANGKAMEVAVRSYPHEAGWIRHSIYAIKEIDVPVAIEPFNIKPCVPA